MDLLADHLTRARASGAVFARTVARPPWGLLLGGEIQLAVHAVARGQCWLWFDEPSEAPIPLSPGRFALVRGGRDHFIGHEPGTPCLEPEAFRAAHTNDAVADDAHATVFLCGAYRFSGDVGQGLVAALPPVIPLTPEIGDPMREVIGLLSRELAVPEPGQTTVLDRLLDVLLVLAVRSSFRDDASAPRWYRASADRRLKSALEAIHGDAAHPWSVPELAKIGGLSRAAFARAFGEALGETPMQYLTEWRMTLARDHLRDGTKSLAEIADAVGYGSPYAFAAAFRRHHGLPPGAWRTRATEAGDAHATDRIHLG